MRWGKWSAHLFEGDRQLCPTQHGRFRGSNPGPSPPALIEQTELSPHGIPYGPVCTYCLRIFRKTQEPPPK